MLCYIHDNINNVEYGLYIRMVQNCKFGQYLKIYIAVNTFYFKYKLQVSLLWRTLLFLFCSLKAQNPENQVINLTIVIDRVYRQIIFDWTYCTGRGCTGYSYTLYIQYHIYLHWESSAIDIMLTSTFVDWPPMKMKLFDDILTKESCTRYNNSILSLYINYNYT